MQSREALHRLVELDQVGELRQRDAVGRPVAKEELGSGGGLAVEVSSEA